jgi:CBS-domain-containing membrane protein
VGVALVTAALPFSPLAGPLALVGLPATLLAALLGLTAVYVAANEIGKRMLGEDREVRGLPAPEAERGIDR